jgi:hypothetical protein
MNKYMLHKINLFWEQFSQKLSFLCNEIPYMHYICKDFIRSILHCLSIPKFKAITSKISCLYIIMIHCIYAKTDYY